MAIARTTAGLAAGLAVTGLLAAWLQPAAAVLANSDALANSSALASARWHATAVHVPAGGSAGTLSGIACTGTSCVAGGSYYHAPAGLLPMVSAESGGRWGTATTISLPANAVPKRGAAIIAAVSCPAATSCVAVGNYETATSLAGLITTGHAATWSAGVAPALPADAAAVPDAYLSGVSCPSAAFCVAAGGYTNTSHNEEPMIVTLSDGRWHRARAIGSPASADANPAAHFSAVSCPRAGYCTAVGGYRTKNLDDEVMAATDVRGRWKRATQIRMPANASVQPDAELYSVSCASVRVCVATGSYGNNQARTYALIASFSRGRWRRAAAFTRLPAGAGRGGQFASLNGVSCGARWCAAAGSYRNARGATFAMVVADAGGRWGRAIRVRLPADAASGSAQSAILFGIACRAAGRCTAAGGYVGRAQAFDPEAMVVSRS